MRPPVVWRDPLSEPDIYLIATPSYVSASLTHGPMRRSVAEADEVEPGIWWVCRVVIHKDHRGKGIGKALVAAMKAACAERGAEVLQVAPGGYDQDTARQWGFYRACGFKDTEEEVGLLVWRPSFG